MSINAKKYVYEGIIVPTALYGAKTCGMISAERNKVIVLDMKCSRSLVEVSRIDRVMNEEECMRAGIESEQLSRAN